MIDSFLGGVAANLLTDALKRTSAKSMDLINKIITFFIGCFITACLIACFMQPFKTSDTFNIEKVEIKIDVHVAAPVEPQPTETP